MGVRMGESLGLVCKWCAHSVVNPVPFPRLSVISAFPSLPSIPPLLFQALVGIVVAHVSHLLSVFVLYALAWQIVPPQSPRRSSIAFVTAFLHIITPGGLFLSAGYAESLFSCLNFAGMLLYALTFNLTPATTKPLARWLGATALLTASGACFGLSTTVRSNGLLSILLFVFAALARVKRILTQDIPSPSGIAHGILSVVPHALASVLTLAGTVYPQYIAYQEYCTDGNTRPWCSHLPPSIYSWVQEHYWNVGFLRYWTLSNLPLFLVAAPMIAVLVSSALIAIISPDILASATSPARPEPKLTETKAGREKRPGSKGGVEEEEEQEEGEEGEGEEKHKSTTLLAHLALPQLILVLLATSTFHVQIVNRIASGYPIWYLVLAIAVTSAPTSTQTSPSPSPSQGKDVTVTSDGDGDSKSTVAEATVLKWQTSARRVADGLWSALAQERRVQWLVRLMVCYAIVQGGLFASFLPPA